MKKINIPVKLNRNWKAGLIGILLFFSIGFVEKKQDDRICNQIEIDIKNQLNNYFINEKDILSLVTEGGEKSIVGTSIDDINLKHIERKVINHQFVKHAEVFKDLKGNLIINVTQKQPIARLIRRAGPDGYISQDGDIMPLSDRYTARVVLVRGAYVDKLIEEGLTKKNEGLEFFKLLQFINENTFWKAQISEIGIDKQMNLTLYPQVGKQEVIFGKPVEIEEKFKKLNIFFREILPHKGWNHYEFVNVKFKDQIICE